MIKRREVNCEVCGSFLHSTSFHLKKDTIRNDEQSKRMKAWWKQKKRGEKEKWIKSLWQF